MIIEVSQQSLWKCIMSMPFDAKVNLYQNLERIIKKEKKDVEYISKEEILAGIEEGLKDVAAGRVKPAREALKELRDEC